jgi:hypothetical protein
MKRLMGKTEVEDALQRLDMLTQEENLMTVARAFEATHHVDVNVKTIQELTQHVDTKVTVIEEVIRATQELTHRVGDNMMEIQELTYDVHADVEMIKEGTGTIDDSVKVTKAGAPIFQFLHTHTDQPLLYVKTVIDDL